MSNKDIEVKLAGISDLDSNEEFGKAKIINGSPTGVSNFTEPSYPWSVSLYELALNYNWHHSEAGITSVDKMGYQKLSPENQLALDRVIAQLITNDSLQTTQLVDNIVQYITDPLVRGLVIRQSGEEHLHSRSYAVITDEVTGHSERIYRLAKTDPKLKIKDEAIQNMYSSIRNGEKVSVHDYQLAVCANQVLEQLVFPGGFLVAWHLAKDMPGVRKMISFIERDETGTHVPIFKNIFRSVKTLYGLDKDTEDECIKLITDMCETEKAWTKDLTKDLLGFTDTTIDMYIEYIANSVCTNLKIPLQYDVTDGGPLMEIYVTHSMLSNVKMKTNQFESKVGDYTVGGLDDNY